MKKLNLLLITSAIAGGSLTAQDKDADLNNYMRSSLYTIILDDKGLMDEHKADIIKSNFMETPLPEKFNDHNLDVTYRTFNPKEFSVTDEELAEVLGGEVKKKKKGGFGGFVKAVASEATGGLVDTTDTSKLPAIFIKYFDTNKVANKMVAKWYNMSYDFNPETSSHFDMELIKERGLYNATEFDKSIADKSTRGTSMLADAGENLINNTFVVGIRFNYVDKAEIAAQVKKTSKAIGGLLGADTGLIDAAADVAGKGYVIKATAFLYQLDWTPEASDKFYTEHYSQEDLSDFANASDYKLKYIGSATEWADVQSTIFTKTTEDELVKKAAVRSVDEVIAKLQKEFEVFRTKTPLLTTEPEVTAYVGLKEGVKGGSKFEVLEKEQDPETGITKYKRVCVIKADKNKIWDNRFGADEERAAKIEAGKEDPNAPVLTATSFTGGNKKIYPGMLIRQIN